MGFQDKKQEKNLNKKLQGETLTTNVGNLFFEKDKFGNLVVWVGGRDGDQRFNREQTEELRRLLNTSNHTF